MKTFAVTNSIVGLLLLSSNSARPMVRSITEHPDTNLMDDFEAPNDIRRLRSSPTNALQLLNTQHAGLLSSEKKVEQYVSKAEQLLTQLRRNRMSKAVDIAAKQASGEASRQSVSGARTIASDAIKVALQGMQHEESAYSALAGGRFDQAALLIKAAYSQQASAHFLIERAGTFQTALIGDENIQKAEMKLSERVHTYKLLPTTTELKAVLHALDKDYSEKLDGSSLEKHQDAATLVDYQATSNSVTHQETSEVIEYQLTEPLIKDQATGGRAKTPILSIEKLNEFAGTPLEAVLHREYGILATTSNLAELKVLECLERGDREKALEFTKKMLTARKQGRAIHKQYEQNGYGTINLEHYHELGHDQSVEALEKLKRSEPFSHNLSSLQLQAIMKRLQLDF